MSAFSEQDFYGSAIHGVIPEGWIDASTLRQIPDHQETFLSPKTLSNLIIEINQRVPTTEALSIYQVQEESQSNHAAPLGGAPNTAETIDKAAALYHLHDLCDEGDSVDVIVPSRGVTLGKFNNGGGGGVSAYTGVVSFTTPVNYRQQRGVRGTTATGIDGGNNSNGVGAINGGGGGGGGRIPVSVDGTAGASSLEGPKTSKSTCHYLLVRLEAQETDLVVFFNVPHDEFDSTGNPRGLSREEELGSETIGKLVECLEVRDWGLFA